MKKFDEDINIHTVVVGLVVLVNIYYNNNNRNFIK